MNQKEKKSRRLKVGEVVEHKVVNLDGETTTVKSKVLGVDGQPNMIKPKSEQAEEKPAEAPAKK